MRDVGSAGDERRRGWWAAAAVIAVLAIAATSRSFLKIPLLSKDSGKYSQCSLGSRIKSGLVEDCSCDYETVDYVNEEVLYPILQELVTTPFFRYFKVKLWCDCSFWPDDGMCRLRDCSVCECPENEFPEPFKTPFHRLLADDPISQEGKPEAIVDDR